MNYINHHDKKNSIRAAIKDGNETSKAIAAWLNERGHNETTKSVARYIYFNLRGELKTTIKRKCNHYEVM